MRLPAATLGLLIAMTVGFALQLLAGDVVLQWLALWPLGDHSLGTDASGSELVVGFLPWQIVTYAFLHGDFNHLFFNALGLYMFGAQLEDVWGRNRFLTYWFACVAGAGALQLVLASSGVLGGGYATVGASGGVYGLVAAYALLFPHRQLMLLIPPIPMKARTLAIGFAVISLALGVTGVGGGVAHFAHLGGMLTGWLMIRYWRGQPPFRPRGPKKPHLRSVN